MDWLREAVERANELRPTKLAVRAKHCLLRLGTRGQFDGAIYELDMITATDPELSE
ncbi:MAG TPA: hypothetical protein VHS06_00800 [Chloroflexota bacterium]|nr:hypothetical protein [Chloroflexota bacterium]